jgi:hypothetical protein
MSNSLAEPISYTTSSDDRIGIIAQEISTIDPSIMANISAASGGLDTVTISNMTSNNYYYTTGSGIGGISAGTITISNGGSSGSSFTIGGAGVNYNWKKPEEFVDSFPDYERIQKMCKEYPGLQIAYEKFVTTYKLVKDHYDTPEDQRPIT